MQFLSGTALKRTVDGREVMSNYLDDGEELVGAKRVVPPQATPDVAYSTLTTIDGTNSQGAEVTEPVTPAEVAEATQPAESTLTLTDDGNSSKAASDEPAEPVEAAEHSNPALADQEVIQADNGTSQEDSASANPENTDAKTVPAAKASTKKPAASK